MRLRNLPTNVLWFCSLALALLPARAKAEVKLPPIISSHMVLQRETQVPIWGTAAAGENVTVTFRDQEKSALADDEGKWLVKLDPLKAGGPDALTITGANTLKLDDVLVGEVWVGSGQSNMQGPVSDYVKVDDVLVKLAAETYPKIRLMGSGLFGSGLLASRLGWRVTEPKANLGFSAQLFAFGVRLQQELDVPVGLVLGAVAGTPSGWWLTEDMMKADAPLQELIKKQTAIYNLEEHNQKHALELVAWEKAVERAKQNNMTPPEKPMPPVWPGEIKRTRKIGYLYDIFIKPFLPYAIRGVVWDQGEVGTAIQDVDQYTLMGALIRGWRRAWGQGDFPFIFVQKPSGGGCAWDPADDVTKQADPFRKLPTSVPSLQAGAYRETHIRIMNYPNTAMAISSDLGTGIHPINKSGYGTRASRVALGMVYGKKVEYYGPVYKEHTVEGNQVRLTFTHVGQGLASKHGDKLQGFAIAGSDKKFVWADAMIDGDAVVVSSPAVAQPVAVRYAWNYIHPWANFFNRDGLPGISFRTDNWEE